MTRDPARRSTEATSTYPLRRTPTQDRAGVQIQRILDAACLEVTERGYDAASTSTIARRAHVAVGSVYRYFPDKRTLMQAVERRNQARYGEAVRARMASGAVRTWRQAVNVTLDTFVEMHRTDPGFRAVVMSGLADPLLESAPGEFDDAHAAEFTALLVTAFGATDTEELRVAVTLGITMGEAVAHLAMRTGPPTDALVIHEGRRALHNLLEPHLPPAWAGPGPPPG